MKPQELRIGNWVLELGWDEDAGGNIVSDPDGNEEIQVDLKWFELQKIKGGITQYSPIPLTPEWLEKFGFEKRDQWTEYLNLDDKTSIKIDSRNNWYLENEAGDSICLHRIKHVHQLQNLYFALCDTELEIIES